MSQEQDPQTAQRLHQARMAVIGCLRLGKSDDQISSLLVREGWKQGEAVAFVQVIRAEQQATPAERPARTSNPAAGRRNMQIGGVLLAIGLGITGITYAAAGDHGGHYVVAYGAIVVGAWRLLLGFIEYSKASGVRSR